VGLVIVDGLDVEQLVTAGPQIRTGTTAAVEGMQLQACQGSVTVGRGPGHRRG
jgi:hypothetical protein